MTSFFVSYNKADKSIAEWIAWTLEKVGHTTVIQAWDFRPGGNFVLDMQRAAAKTDKTIVVLSEHYLSAKYTQPEWAAAFASDPESQLRKLIPIRVGECQPNGLLGPLSYVDLVGLEEAAARQAILDSLEERVKPTTKPPFLKEQTMSPLSLWDQLIKESIPATKEIKFQELDATNDLLKLDNLEFDFDNLEDDLESEIIIKDHDYRLAITPQQVGYLTLLLKDTSLKIYSLLPSKAFGFCDEIFTVSITIYIPQDSSLAKKKKKYLRLLAPGEGEVLAIITKLSLDLSWSAPESEETLPILEEKHWNELWEKLKQHPNRQIFYKAFKVKAKD